jgi:exonuclease VII small subunit
MPKMKKVPVWLVKIVMPKKLMQEIQQGSLELESETLDLEDVNQAYEEGDDAAENTSGEEQDNEQGIAQNAQQTA